jgi:integrase/recombinase XerD
MKSLQSGTDADDREKRDTSSLTRYKQDLRWFDGWLDDHGVDGVHDLASSDAHAMGIDLSESFSGTTGRYRWDRIYAFYEHLLRLEEVGSNPLERWNDVKDDELGLSKSTEQQRRSESGNEYAVSQDEIRLMEENVGRNRERDQLLLRLLWQTLARRGASAATTLDMVDEDRREIRFPAAVTKNDQPRVVGWSSNVDALLDRWLNRGLREEYLGGEEHEYLFVGERGAPLSGAAINDIVVEAAKRAGLNEQVYADANSADGEANRWLISAHNIRHGAASHVVNEDGFDSGSADIYSLSKYLGHQSVEITEQRYIEPSEDRGLRGLRGSLPE